MKIFDRENIDKLLEICQICKYFPHQNFALYDICMSACTYLCMYHIRGLFGSDFNLVVWQIFIGSLNLNYAILTFTHEMN